MEGTTTKMDTDGSATETDSTTEAPAETPPPAAAAEEDTPLGDGGKRALDAERRSRRAAEKQAAELAARLKEFEDRDKTEAEKLAARLQSAEQEAASARLDALRLRVGAELGIPADLVEFLTGTDEDGIRSQADKLMAATRVAPAAPKPDPTQGAKPAASSGQLTRADMASMSPEQINQALTEGRFADLLAGRS